jgi:predicted metal-dependent peptidase
MAHLLLDPQGMAPDDFNTLNEKVQVAHMLLSKNQEKGGAPLIYAFSAAKPHYLADISVPIYTDAAGNQVKWPTAATDGAKYLWHPETLRRLSPKEIAVYMCHETYHVILQHTDIHRVMGKNHKVWNIAVDYVVHTMIEHDFRHSKSGDLHTQYGTDNHPIFKGNIGKPLSFAELIAAVKASQKYVRSIKDGKEKKEKTKNLPTRNGPPKPEDMRLYADYSLYGKSAEDIYNDIMVHVKDMSDDLLEMFLESINANSLDEHKSISISKSKLLQEVLDAVNAAKRLDNAGKLPSGVEEQLGKLLEPKLSWQDIACNMMQTKRQEKGNKNDWSRFRRRSISLNLQPSLYNEDPFYIPKKKDDYVSWIGLLDTSGSMRNEDMCYGVSQLKCMDGRSDGWVVCCDAETYWDKKTHIRNMEDLPQINPVGRGGTVFDSFFNDYREKIGQDFDIIIIMTDGEICGLDDLKRPHCDVLWVLTNEHDKTFKPPFGRVAPMRSF